MFNAVSKYTTGVAQKSGCSVFRWKENNVYTDSLVISNNLLFSSCNMKCYLTFILLAIIHMSPDVSIQCFTF